MRLRLTDRIARDLPAPAKGRLVVFDEQQPGLIFRMTPNDARTFAVWVRRRSGAKEILTLGKLGDLSLSEARALTRQTRFEIMAGAPLSVAKRKSASATEPHKGLRERDTSFVAWLHELGALTRADCYKSLSRHQAPSANHVPRSCPE